MPHKFESEKCYRSDASHIVLDYVIMCSPILWGILLPCNLQEIFAPDFSEI